MLMWLDKWLDKLVEQRRHKKAVGSKFESWQAIPVIKALPRKEGKFFYIPIDPHNIEKINEYKDNLPLPLKRDAEGNLLCVKKKEENKKMNWVESVKFFQQKLEKRNPNHIMLFRHRMDLVNEEIQELALGGFHYLCALSEKDTKRSKEARIEILDAIADSIFVLIGTANALDMDIDTAMQRVIDSNMTKFGDDGNPIYNAEGKVMKGPNFKLPELEDLI